MELRTVPTTIEEIEAMVRNQVQEDLHLDYKDSRAIHNGARSEIAKDVSAFANSDGGVIIYGVREKSNLPVQVDEGVEATPCSKEWLESAILTAITPRIEDCRIYPIPRSTDRFLYVVQIPKSFRGPHQASDKRYYKRHNFKSEPMEDYEIADVRSRRRRFPPLVTFQIAVYKGLLVAFEIRNVGDVLASDVRFEFSPEIPWPTEDGMPLPFRKGIRSLPPKQQLRFRYFAFHQIFGEHSSVPRQFSVRISYFHPEMGNSISDEWEIDLDAYIGSMRIRSEAEEQMSDAIKGLTKLTEQVQQLKQALEPIHKIIGPSGLQLSVSTVRNLRRALNGGGLELLDSMNCAPDVFTEVLGVDWDMALALSNVFGTGGDRQRLKSIPGMTDALLAKIHEHFLVGGLGENDRG